jgi:hypothetical protein
MLVSVTGLTIGTIKERKVSLYTIVSAIYLLLTIYSIQNVYFREIIFMNRKKYKLLNVVVCPILFISINLVLGILSFNKWFDALPITASAFVTISLWIDNPKLTKAISIPVSTAFLIYNICVYSYIGIINESIAILSIIIFFIKVRKK